ncbi:MAG: protease inhibitor I42 family protein [Anaerolineales bacterium]|nr:protease inhibitor I42 family protein [Anaerolineales bacterium]
MRRQAGLLIFLILVALGTAACGGPVQAPAEEVEVITGEEIELRIGETATISRRGHPVAGFLWEITTPPSEILEQVGELVVELDSDDDDSEASFIFTFRAVAAGTTSIKMIYHQPFEDAPPTAVYEASIVIIP